MKSFAALVSTIALVVPFVAADFVPAGTAAHFFSSQNSSLVFGAEYGGPGANLFASLPGDGSAEDFTAFFALKGTGVPSTLGFLGACITTDGIAPGSAFQQLYVAECDSSKQSQLWTVNEEPATISNADGNCVTLGKAAEGLPVTIAECTDELLHLQTWNAKRVSA